MVKQMVMGLSALVLVGAGYTSVMAEEEGGGCPCQAGDDTQVVLAVAATTAPAEKVDVKNTKCLVMKEDEADAKVTAEHNGKVYHFCCKKCIAKFNKDPEKYIKALEADPAAYGVEKK